MHQVNSFATLPIGLILQLKRKEKNLPKFKLCCDFTQIHPKYKPTHLLVAAEHICGTEYSGATFGLLPLGKYGVDILENRLVKLNDENGRLCGIFSDEYSLFHTHKLVICEWNEKQVKVSETIDLEDRQFATILINQDDVEQSLVVIKDVEVPASKELLFQAHHRFDVSFAPSNVHFHTYPRYIAHDSHLRLSMLSVKFHEGKEQVNRLYSQEEITRTCYCAVMENRSGSMFVLRFDSEDPSTASIGSIYLERNNFTFTSIHFDNFCKLWKENRLYIKPLCHTKLTDGKYLFLAQCNSKRGNNHSVTTFQQLFTDRSIWLLVDLNEKRTKRVFPRVYDLGKQTITQPEYTLVKNKKDGRKEHTTPLYEDGDLNGGYTDRVLLKNIKPSISLSDLDEKDRSIMVPVSQDEITKHVTMRAFRPFYSNPDLFQVMVFFTKSVANDVRDLDREARYGKMFRFFFKFRDETKVKVRKVGSRFADVLFKFK